MCRPMYYVSFRTTTTTSRLRRPRCTPFYRNALVTLSATGFPDVSSGVFLPRVNRVHNLAYPGIMQGSNVQVHTADSSVVWTMVDTTDPWRAGQSDVRQHPCSLGDGY